MTTVPERTRPERDPTVPSLLAARRTVRFYSTTRVAPEQVRALLEAAALAPSAHNAQPTRFVVIESDAVKRRLAEQMARRWRRDLEALGTTPAAIEVEIRFSLKRFGQAPLLILVGYTMEHMDVYPDATRRAAERAMAVQSAAAAVQNLLLAAAANGLG